MRKANEVNERLQRYNFHKVSISCTQNVDILKSVLKHPEILAIRSIRCRKGNRIRYKSSIELVSPSKDVLQYLLNMEGKYLKDCKISYLEISRDKYYESLYEAELDISRLLKKQRKKYSGGFQFDGTSKAAIPEKGLYATSTYYHGSVLKKKRK